MKMQASVPLGGRLRFVEVLIMRKSKKPRSHSVPPVTLSANNDQQVLRFRDWCRLNGISERTGRRVLNGPNGPTVTMLSAKLIGVTVANNRRWQEARARA
jgi:hypothetical protein